jgi:hypothetical protein
MPAFGVDCWLYDFPGEVGDARGLIWIPRPGAMASSNLERLSFLESCVPSSLVRCGIEAYSGREVRISGDPKGDMRDGGGGSKRSMA